MSGSVLITNATSTTHIQTHKNIYSYLYLNRNLKWNGSFYSRITNWSSTVTTHRIQDPIHVWVRVLDECFCTYPLKLPRSRSQRKKEIPQHYLSTGTGYKRRELRAIRVTLIFLSLSLVLSFPPSLTMHFTLYATLSLQHRSFDCTDDSQNQTMFLHIQL